MYCLEVESSRVKPCRALLRLVVKPSGAMKGRGLDRCEVECWRETVCHGLF